MDLARLQELASAGDADARAELMRVYYPRVRDMVHRELERDFRKSHRWILPLFSTGDVVQEVFVAVLQSIDRFEVQGDDAFVRYLSTLVKHRLVDAVRHHEAARRDSRRRIGPTDADADHAESGSPGVPVGVAGAAADDPTPSLAASLAEQLDAFHEVLDTFDERERALLQLRLVEEAPHADVAHKLGYPSADAARKAFQKVHARMLVRLRARGIRPPEARP